MTTTEQTQLLSSDKEIFATCATCRALQEREIQQTERIHVMTRALEVAWNRFDQQAVMDERNGTTQHSSPSNRQTADVCKQALTK